MCHSIGASRPPTTRPMKDPAMPATMFSPSPRPRWVGGKASVMIALELAISIAPPLPWQIPSATHPRGRRSTVQPRDREHDREEREDREPGVVDPHPPIHVTKSPEADHQDGR